MAPPRQNVNRDDSKAFWERIQQRIFDQVPPHDIYEDIGVRDISASPDSGGWYQCRGFGRADRNKSAQFHSESGYWMDFADPEAEGTIWEVVAKHGGFSGWEAARDHYAGRAGVDIPKPGNGAWKKHKSQPHESRPRKKAVEKETLHENLLALALACHEQAKASGILDRYCEKEGFSRFAADAMLVGFMDRKKPIFQSKSIAACDYMTLPEVQADRTIETLLRCPWNKGFDKLGLAGRPRGIYTPRGWSRRAAKTGYIVIPEGGSDTLAATTMGLGAIGYHGARTGDGAAILATHIRQRLDYGSLPSDIKIVLTQDNDAGAGASGTAQVGQYLADALGRPIYRRRMPVVGWSVGYAEIPWDLGHIPKDVREYLRHEHLDSHLFTDDGWERAGKRFLNLLIGWPDVRPKGEEATPGRRLLRRAAATSRRMCRRTCSTRPHRRSRWNRPVFPRHGNPAGRKTGESLPTDAS